jgi:hypothetical protein
MVPPPQEASVLTFTWRLIAGVVIVQLQPPLTELFAQNTVLFAKAVNDLQLALIHPTGHGD